MEDEDVDGVPLDDMNSILPTFIQTTDSAYSAPPSSSSSSSSSPLPPPLPPPVSLLAAARAAQEEKRRRQEEEAAAVYANFVASFEDEGKSIKSSNAGKSQRFVKGGIIGGSAEATILPPVPSPSPSPAISSDHQPIMKKRGREVEENTSPSPPPLPPSSAFGSAKRRQMDLFLEELKQQQQQKERGGGGGGGERFPSISSSSSPYQIRALPPSSSSTDPMLSTSNLFLSNLPFDCTGDKLIRYFVRFGDIASCRMMRPKAEEEKSRGMQGFIAFMKRKDAEEAIREVNGVVWNGCMLRVHWARPIPLPSHPVARADRSRQSSIDRPSAPLSSSAGRIVISFPSSPSRRAAIDQLAKDVSELGFDWEQQILEREAKERINRGGRGGGADPFDFLFDFDCPDNLYYRWRVYSLTHGGTMKEWSVQPFNMTPNGPLWIPPPRDNPRRQEEEVEEEEEDEKEEASALSSDDLTLLSSLLSPLHLSLFRSSILRAMGFCLRHSTSAPFIVRLICRRIRLSEAVNSCHRLALLYLLSDCLYNSSAPVRNASCWRREVEKMEREREGRGNLAETFARWSQANIGKLEREKVIEVLRAWEGWTLFDSKQIHRWEMEIKGINNKVKMTEEETTERKDKSNDTNRGQCDSLSSVSGDTIWHDEDVDGVPLV